MGSVKISSISTNKTKYTNKYTMLRDDRLTRELYHTMEPSFYPLGMASCAFMVAITILMWVSYCKEYLVGGLYFINHSELSVVSWNLFISISTSLMVMMTWADDLWYEKMTKKKMKAYYFMFMLFISSEVMFFGAFFFSRVFLELNRADTCFPPLGIVTPHGLGWPSLGFSLLLMSGWSVNWAQKSSVYKCYYNTGWALSIAILLGTLFLTIQYSEYSWLGFCINDGVFGSLFFMMTGFHGLHVIVGLVMLSTLYYYCTFHQLMSSDGCRMIGWYWHFVDVVWIAVWASLYIIPTGW